MRKLNMWFRNHKTPEKESLLKSAINDNKYNKTKVTKEQQAAKSQITDYQIKLTKITKEKQNFAKIVNSIAEQMDTSRLAWKERKFLIDFERADFADTAMVSRTICGSSHDLVKQKKQVIELNPVQMNFEYVKALFKTNHITIDSEDIENVASIIKNFQRFIIEKFMEFENDVFTLGSLHLPDYRQQSRSLYERFIATVEQYQKNVENEYVNALNNLSDQYLAKFDKRIADINESLVHWQNILDETKKKQDMNVNSQQVPKYGSMTFK